MSDYFPIDMMSDEQVKAELEDAGFNPDDFNDLTDFAVNGLGAVITKEFTDSDTIKKE